MSASINLGIYDTSDFDCGAPRWKRSLWVLVSSVFFQNPFPKAARFRAALLRAFGARVGKGVLFGSNVYISYPWRLTVGDHVWIGDDVGIRSLAQVTIDTVDVSKGSLGEQPDDIAIIVRPDSIFELHDVLDSESSDAPLAEFLALSNALPRISSMKSLCRKGPRRSGTEINVAFRLY